MADKNVVFLGGLQAAKEERIYPEDAQFEMPDGTIIKVYRSVIQGADMEALFARHIARYCQAMVFCRPGQRVLDFPCGCGYAAPLFRRFDVFYEGRDADPVTVAYARHIYGAADGRTEFSTDDLCDPQLSTETYDTVACIEGLEHIEMPHQDGLVAAFKKALRPGGTLVVSSPENPDGVSGQSRHNPWHIGELTREDFLALLCRHFPEQDVELVSCRSPLSSGVTTTMLFGICHR